MAHGLALRGTEAETRAVAAAYKVFYEKVPSPSGKTSSIDHMAFTCLLDRQGKYMAFVSLPSYTSFRRRSGAPQRAPRTFCPWT